MAPGLRGRSSDVTDLPLGAVSVAWVTLIVGLGIFEDEAVGPLNAVGALLHTVGAVFEVQAFDTLVWALKEDGTDRIPTS